MRIRANGFVLFLLLFLTSLLVASIFPPLRYIKYFLPLFPLPFYFLTSGIVDRSIFRYYYTFIIFYSIVILFLLIENLIFSDLSQRFLPNAIFILSPLLFISFILPYFRPEKLRSYIKLILFFNIVVFFYEEGADLLSVLTNLTILQTAIITSEIPTESNLAYLFGFLVIYFYLDKYPLRYKVIAFVFFVLCFKRIVIAAALVSCGCYFLMRMLHFKMPRYRKITTVLGIAANLLFVKFTQLLVNGRFDALVYEKTGFSTDRFLMGRKTFYEEAYEKAGTFNWTGLGLGRMDDILFNLYGIPVNLHSEVLRTYFEFGAIIFVAWLFLLLYKNLFSLKAATILIYFNILILTDNVFIYFEVMFYFYFFILIFLHERSQQSKVQHENLDR